MGGKTKQTHRTKNNVKPSSSARSAELLGSAPTFVGFSAHSDLGIVPFAPGFTTFEQMPDTFDASISPQYQLTLKKLSKKDPMTKKKALQEFIDLINSSELEELKIILPLWPKFYHNLATDPEHNVRELSQTVLQLLVSKCKKAVAPYLKQLVPVWLASQFDNYAPAASIACTSFNETFVCNGNRTCEVCVHCQNEILEYVTLNLTFHTASTLSTGKNLSSVEAEQKYQRVVMCSLKELSFFIEHTVGATDQTQIFEGLQKLLSHQKFWSFAKSNINYIRAAWFELMYYLLQSPKQQDLFATQKSKMITIAFRNIDDSDPLVSPNIWGCILLIQTNYKNWYEITDFHKNIWPKFTYLLRNAFNRNAQAICPNILPFFSQLSQVTTDINEYHTLIKQFFDNIRDIIITENSTLTISKQDNKIIIKTYFECVRYLIQKVDSKKEEIQDEEKVIVLKLLEDNIVGPIKWCLMNPNELITKYFFQHTSTFVAFCDMQLTNSTLYQTLFDKFWLLLFTIIMEDLNKQDVDELYLERVVELINDLYLANPSLEEHKVKFVEDNVDKDKTDQFETAKEPHTTVAFIQNELKQLVLQLTRICLKKTLELKISKYIKHVRLLCNMFNDKEFFAKVSDDNNLDTTLLTLVNLLKTQFLDDEACEIVVDVVFEILQKLEKQQRFSFIEKELIKIPYHLTQTLILHRLLSHPLCIEPEVRSILQQDKITEIISKIAIDVVTNNSKDLFNFLHKCFFQTDTGDILISSKTVNSILNILSEPLISDKRNKNYNTDVDACGSFIAQIMPVVCSNENSSQEVRHKVFLRLFKFSVEKSVNENISEDTLWEITTCWQDALSSEDIIIDGDLLQKCTDIVEQQGSNEQLSTTAIDSMSGFIAKFAICCTENSDEESVRSLKIDKVLKVLLKNNTSDIQDLLNVCLFVESLKDVISPSSDLIGNIRNFSDLKLVLQRSLLNFSTLCKLVCKTTKPTDLLENADVGEDELTEDYCDPNENLIKIWSEFLQTQLIQYINIAACGDTLLTYVTNLDNKLESLCLELSEKVRLLFRQSGELSVILKERLLEESVKGENINYCRSLPYLVNIEQYAQFEESGTLLLAEDLQEYLATQKAFKAYINTLQYLLPKLEAKTISSHCPIMRCETPDMWIKAAVFRCLIKNNFSSSYNDKSDRNIITLAVQFITQHSDKLHTQKDMLLYQTEIHTQDMVNVLNAVEYMNLLTEVLSKVPHQLTIKNWDVIRIGLGHWILSLTKSLDYALENGDQKTMYFTLHVFKLFAALTTFFDEEKQKSSTELIKSVYDEWIQVFSRDVYLTLFKSFYKICIYRDISANFSDCWEIFLNELTTTMEHMDYGIVYTFCKNSNQITLDHVCNFLLKNLSSPVHSLRTLSMFMMRQFIPHFVADDIQEYNKKSEQINKDDNSIIKWHLLNRFEEYIGRYDMPVQKYIDEFNFKLSEIAEMKPIDPHEAFSYLMLWDCIIYACAKSPVALRSVYTSWLNENKYEENLLHFLFRSMPFEILKNHSTKQLNNDIFKGLSWSQIKDPNLSLEKYACHLYTDVLSKLPAVVRKWWNTSSSRQKTFVDTLTTNFVSPIICQAELMAIANKKEKHENMQVTVHMSSREVLAVYSIDEARMELVITLAHNYPLGSVKVDCNKQIGGRSSSRSVAMQLTIFLTYQNGTIFDGLALWKNNLDKKFEGVEECYVCYTVIHQDTCQLPKLTCKTCKKKFHGPCLYKWFTISSKSTCPICRNVF